MGRRPRTRSPVRTKDKWGAFEEVIPVLAAAEPNLTYFNIDHIGGGELPDSIPLTLEAYPDGGGEAVSSLHIRLVKPAVLPEKVIQVLPIQPGQRWGVTSGDSLPIYDCRWWPRRAEAYASFEPPPLSIVRDKNSLLVQWQDQVVARILDRTNPPYWIGQVI
ncbi:MAG: hypothetical protein M5U34_18480 [Chloroflexi bacterium]|nr:hypothetical protein [Chloroflexota bacterium]